MPEKFKINLYCNDRLEPSSSDKNEQKYTEWAYDGSGVIDFYVNQRVLEPFGKVKEKTNLHLVARIKANYSRCL